MRENKSPGLLLISVFGAWLGSAGALLAADHQADSARAFDLQGFIDRQIQTGTNRVVIPSGRYLVTPKQGAHLRFQNLTNLEIVAEGVEMVCTETRPAIRINQCRNLHLRGLTVDYDPLPFTEGRIVALAQDKSWLEFQIIPGYPEDNLVERIEFYDPATGELRRESYYGWGQFERIGPGRYRITKGAKYAYRPEVDTEEVGDILVTNHAFPAHAGGHAIELSECVGVKLEDVTLYASPVFGFFENRCDGNLYLRCKIDRRPPENDPVKRDFARMRSLNADGYHSSEATRGPAIIDCVAKFNGDDSVAIHGHFAMILTSTGVVLRVVSPARIAIEVGDPVQFLPFQGRCPADAVVRNIEPDIPLADGEKAFVKQLGLHAGIKSKLLAGEGNSYRVTLDREVRLPIGSLIAAASRLGNGFLVQGCDLGYNRSRGILIKAGHGQVLNNTITHGWMAGVLVSPEFWWFEGGSASDVLIRGNQIIGCRQPAIQVLAPGGNGQPLASGAHRDITISSNTISESVWPNIRVTSTARLVICGNQLTAAPPGFAARPRSNRSARAADSTRPISVTDCFQPEVQSLP